MYDCIVIVIILVSMAALSFIQEKLNVTILVMFVNRINWWCCEIRTTPVRVYKNICTRTVSKVAEKFSLVLHQHKLLWLTIQVGS